MLTSAPVDGFRLAYERAGSGSPVVLLHGWPGDHTDYDDLVPLLSGGAEVIVPDLRGFGQSDKHAEPPGEAYSAADRLDHLFSHVELRELDGVGHFTPLEARRRSPTRSAER